MALSGAFVLAGYEFVRSAATTLFKQAYGSGGLPVGMALGPVALALALPLYGRILSAWGTRVTLHLTHAASSVAIVACVLGIRAGWAPAAGALFVLREAWIVLLVEQLWAFLDSSVNSDSSRRLNGPVTGIASIGAILGGLLVGRVAPTLGTLWLPVLSVGAMALASCVMEVAYRRCGEPQGDVHQARGLSGHLGLQPFRQHPVLGFMLAMMVVTQFALTALDLRFQGILSLELPDPDAQTAWSGHFFAALNGASALFQFVVVPVFLPRVRPTVLLLSLPIVNLVAWGFMAVHPTLFTVGGAFLLFKSLDYSLFRGIREVLYVPLPFDARYRSKEIVDALGYRFGKGAASLFFLALRPFALAGDAMILGVAAAAEVTWLGLAALLHRRR